MNMKSIALIVSTQFKAFRENGGRCLGWGSGLQAGALPDIEDVKSGEGAVARSAELCQ